MPYPCCLNSLIGSYRDVTQSSRSKFDIILTVSIQAALWQFDSNTQRHRLSSDNDDDRASHATSASTSSSPFSFGDDCDGAVVGVDTEALGDDIDSFDMDGLAIPAV